MLALTFDGQAPRLEEREVPALGEGQVLLRPLRAGICNTDLEITRGYLGFTGTLGHEVVGVVEEGPAAWKGKRVACEINFACGVCELCLEGLERHCPHRTTMGIVNQDGAFAERVAVPVANLHEVPDAVSDDEATFTEPLAAAFEILEQLGGRVPRDAVVLGDGKLGLLIAQVLHAAGIPVLAVGKHRGHLDILAARGIATTLLDDWDRGKRELVVEATGTQSGFTMAMAATRPRGILVLKSTVADRGAIDLAPLVIDEITVMGSRCGPFVPALEALAAKQVDVTSMIAATMPLRDGVAALERAGERGTLKVLLRID